MIFKRILLCVGGGEGMYCTNVNKQSKENKYKQCTNYNEKQF